jgi:hypothetical protein
MFFSFGGKRRRFLISMIKLHPINGVLYANVNETFIPLFHDEPTRIQALGTNIQRVQFLRELLPLGSCYRIVLEKALRENPPNRITRKARLRADRFFRCFRRQPE